MGPEIVPRKDLAALGVNSVLSRVRWEEVNREVGEQRTNREKHFPIISAFRWWARRQHAVIGALIDAAEEEFGREGLLVADPFSGGGTVAIEAARRGLPVYAQDLYPWPVRGLATALTPAAPEDLAAAGRELLEKLEPLKRCYRRRVGFGEWEATHILRVKVISCPSCEDAVRLFREPLISLVSRRKGESEAFFGCRACGSVSRRRADVKRFECGDCRRRWPNRREKPPGTDVMIHCPHCSHDITYSSTGQSARWEAILVQERPVNGEKKPTELRPAQAGDPVADTPETPVPQPLREQIPDGVETRRLRTCGYREWADLYTQRQVHVISEALAEVTRLQYPEPVRRRLALAIMGAAEMPGYLCRWDRYNLKAFEAVANHRYAHHTCVAVETNLLSELGRGTLPRRILAAEKALSWLTEQDRTPQIVRSTSNQKRIDGEQRQDTVEGVLIAEGSSTTQLLPDGAARLVLTDPPYHDDVQYGELARLFHVWLRTYDAATKIDERSEATPNPRRGIDTAGYEALVGGCLAESRRTLAPNGSLILTYHNNNLCAWEALAGALRRAGFVVIGLAVVDSENAGDHGKRGKKVFLSDLVLESVAHEDTETTPTPSLYSTADSEDSKNLLAIGLAVAEACASENSGTIPGAEDMKRRYSEHLRRLGGENELIH